MIQAQGITRIYKTETETTALHDITMEIKQGDLVAITGPSGCGKSTLLNIIGMIDKPDRGSYYFNGTRVDNAAERKRSQLRKDNIGFIFQSFNLVNELTVYENIELPLLYTGMANAARKDRVTELLDELKMSHRKDHYPQQLSGGQQQRVAVARAISNKPLVILADEPTGNLDSAHGDEVMRTLMQLNEDGTTIIMVTHAPHYARYCRRTIGLLDGKIVTEQTNHLLHV
jgi:putative ABC transport system ATP-binding protein